MSRVFVCSRLVLSVVVESDFNLISQKGTSGGQCPHSEWGES